MFGFALKLMKFFGFAGVFYVTLVILWGELFSGEKLKKNILYTREGSSLLHNMLREAEEVKDVDLLILGSSHAYRGFDNRIFEREGINTFNLGSSNQTFIQTKVLLEEYLDKINPKMVIFEVYPEIFEKDGVESALDILSNKPIKKKDLKVVPQTNNILVVNSFIYALYKNITDPIHKFQGYSSSGDDLYISGGYVRKYTKSTFSVPEERNRINWEPRKDQVQAFRECLNILEAKNLEVVLVYAPIPQNSYAEYKNTREIHSFFKKTKYKFVDYNTSVDLVDTLHFYDNEHLNHAGVKIFNNHLIEDFKNKGYFSPDIRARRTEWIEKVGNRYRMSGVSSDGNEG